jgi:hypothetical protein
VRGLGVAHAGEPGSELVLGQAPEAEVLVQGAVPRDVGEGGEGHGAQAPAGSPRLHRAEQAAAEPLALVVGQHGELLDVRAPVDHVHDDVAGGGAVGVEGDPAPPGRRVRLEALGGGRLVRGDLGQAHVGEPPAGLPLDLAEALGVLGAPGADHRPSLRATEGRPQAPLCRIRGPGQLWGISTESMRCTVALAVGMLAQTTSA